MLRAVNRRAWISSAVIASATVLRANTSAEDDRSRPVLDRGAIVRGARDRKRLALVFTGDQYAEGARTILETLRRRQIKAALFLTGRFLRDKEFRPLIERARDEGHDLGPHSDKHLLYASWDRPPKLLVTRKQFIDDLSANDRSLADFVKDPGRFPYFIPPYEHFTAEIVRWAAAAGWTLINMTPGTLSHTDYMEDDNPPFVPARRIVDSVFRTEKSAADGLNGFLLLMHLGAGPRRTRDHLHTHLDELVSGITDRGYEIVRVAELLAKAPSRQ